MTVRNEEMKHVFNKQRNEDGKREARKGERNVVYFLV
jgi:hypothetical protein